MLGKPTDALRDGLLTGRFKDAITPGEKPGTCTLKLDAISVTLCRTGELVVQFELDGVSLLEFPPMRVAPGDKLCVEVSCLTDLTIR